MGLNNYLLIEIIGKGSYGEVWLVRQKDKERKKFVLKKISFHKASEKEMEAARQECQLLKSLEHPNIVQYRDSFEENNSLYIAMAFCEEGDLYKRLKDRNGILLSEKQIVEWLIQITMALSYIHERNILHRDLKTQNVFLARSVIKIGDLGIAKQLENKYDMAKTIIGTPYYMSPELFAKRPYNFKSDIWSLGCVTYEMATLKHAFNAKNYTALSYKILNGHTPDMPSIYSKDLICLITDMLNKKPEKRPPTGKILCNPYIRHHIQMFVEKSKRASKLKHSKSLSKNHIQKLSRDSQDSSYVSSQSSDIKSNNSNKKISTGISPKENKIIPISQSRDENTDNYDDNDDVVIARSSNESQSKKSSTSSHKENDERRKSSQTELEKELKKGGLFEKIHNQSPTQQVQLEQIVRSPSLPCFLKDEILKESDQSANLIARQRRRQKKRDQGLRTLLIANDDADEKANSNSDISEHPNVIGNRRRRQRHDSYEQNASKIVLPELRRIETTETFKDESLNQEVLQVVEKMNETLTFNGVQKFVNMKDSILIYKDQKDPIGPSEDEQETLNRTKFQNIRYQEIRKELMKEIGYAKVAKCFDVLQDLDQNHETQLGIILGDDNLKKYFGKIIWLKMAEEG